MMVVCNLAKIGFGKRKLREKSEGSSLAVAGSLINRGEMATIIPVMEYTGDLAVMQKYRGFSDSLDTR